MAAPGPGLGRRPGLDAHPLVDNGPTSTLRMVAPGAVTRGRYGLVEYRVAPHSAGAAPHYHQTFFESFYVLTGQLTIYADGAWQPYRPGDFALVHETGVHGFRNDGDEETSFLILFAPGIAWGTEPGGPVSRRGGEEERSFLFLSAPATAGEIFSAEGGGLRNGAPPRGDIPRGGGRAFSARHDQVMVEG